MATAPIVSIRGLTKTYASGFQALKGVDLDIRPGEIFALLGPNGAGKTTLINVVCGIVKATAGTVTAAGHDIVKDFREARAAIGLVPQELSTDMFETPWDTVSFSRGLFGKPKDPQVVEQVLRDLALWDKRGDKIMTLSGGMKRRVLIAKALSHEPRILFLDEPTAGVDVALRRDMWNHVRALRQRGVSIILTTHYIEEAEEMADRIGVIHKGELVVVEEKATLLEKLGQKRLVLELAAPLAEVPPSLAGYDLVRSQDGLRLTFTMRGRGEAGRSGALLRDAVAAGLELRDVSSAESSLEEIFVGLVEGTGGAPS